MGKRRDKLTLFFLQRKLSRSGRFQLLPHDIKALRKSAEQIALIHLKRPVQIACRHTGRKVFHLGKRAYDCFADICPESRRHANQEKTAYTVDSDDICAQMPELLPAVCEHDSARYLIIFCDIGIGITTLYCRLYGDRFRRIKTVIINHISSSVQYDIFPFRSCVFKRHII